MIIIAKTMVKEMDTICTIHAINPLPRSDVDL